MERLIEVATTFIVLLSVAGIVVGVGLVLFLVFAALADHENK